MALLKTRLIPVGLSLKGWIYLLNSLEQAVKFCWYKAPLFQQE